MVQTPMAVVTDDGIRIEDEDDFFKRHRGDFDLLHPDTFAEHCEQVDLESYN